MVACFKSLSNFLRQNNATTYVLKVSVCVCVLLLSFTLVSRRSKQYSPTDIKDQAQSFTLVSRRSKQYSPTHIKHQAQEYMDKRDIPHIPKEFVQENLDHNNEEQELSFGHIPWTGKPLDAWFNDFKHNGAMFGNDGGMRLAHQFAVYTVLKTLQPKYVIESGVWRGATTRLIRKLLPEVHIISIDPLCVNKKSRYQEVVCGKDFKDFKNMEERWRTMDKNNTLVIFDDHQSGFLRILQSVKFGFKYIMIEDNYPMGSGDNYSPKQVLSNVKTDEVPFLDNFGKVKKMISRKEHYANRDLFKRVVKTYVEFPPLNKKLTVDWLVKTFKGELEGGTRNVFTRITADGLGLKVPFNIEHLHYRFICYMELNKFIEDINEKLS